MADPAIGGDLVDANQVSTPAASIPVANMLSAADTAIKKVHDLMGVNAALLKYLPTDRIRVAPFVDKKRERPNALPLRIHFGVLKHGRQKSSEIWILLHKPYKHERSPEQRLNVFDRHGALEEGITTDDAIRLATYSAAFKCIMETGSIEKAKLRAVMKYYFIVQKVDIPLPWPVETQFIEDLVAACKLACNNSEKAGLRKEQDKDRQAAAQSVLRSESIVCGTPAGLKSAPLPDGTPDPNNKSYTQTGMNPGVTPLQHHSTINLNARGVSVRQDSGQTGDTKAKEGSSSMSIDTTKTEQPANKCDNTPDPEDFVSSYRKILAESEAQAEMLALNEEAQAMVAEQIHALQDKMVALQEQKKQMQAERRQAGIRKKRLRESLSAKERALLTFGAELAERETIKKRVKTKSSSVEVDSGLKD